MVDFGSVSSGTTYPVELAFESDTEFEIKSVRTNLSGTTEAKITITKAGGESLSNAAFELRAIAGSNNVLNIFDEVIVQRGTKWNISANVSAGASQPLQLQFWGYKRG